MKNYKILIGTAFLLFLNLNLTMAQQDIAGYYRRSSGNPEGGNSFFVLENQKFVVAFFGGAIVGTWSIENDLVSFKPDVSEHHFYIYGRHNPDLKDSSRVYFQSFEQNDTFIGFQQKQGERLVLRRVFNKSPNCVPFPSVAKFKGGLAQILLSDQPDYFHDNESDPVANRNVYTFDNKENYNDFVAFYVKDDRDKRPFYARAKDGKLFFNHDEKGSEKRPLPKSGEDFEFINQLVNAPRTVDKVFFNPFYKQTTVDVNDVYNWKFNKNKNAFINFLNYEEGEEYRPREQDAYNKLNIIYQYDVLPLANKKVIPFLFDNHSLFTATCD